MTITEDGPAFVAHATCGCTVGLTHQGPKDDARAVAEWVRRGYRVTQMTVAESRKVPWYECPKHVRHR